ncbi:MAG: hypothetical protein HRT57_12060 [Crocinitomicaceae bacterium]|nr:hypothetical protein [Crocinitomicaceae bacterium]
MKILLLSLFLFSIFQLQAQSSEAIAGILKHDRVQLRKLTPAKSETSTLLPSRFAKEIISNPSVNYKQLTVVKVYYFYTKYRQSRSFNQAILDEKRFNELNEIVPGILDNPYIEWELVEQTGCSSPVEGRSFYHGFVLIHRPVVSELVREKEIARLEEFLKNPTSEFKVKGIDNLEDIIKESADVKIEELKNTPAGFDGGDFALFQYFRDNLKGGGKVALNRDDLWVTFKVDVDENGELAKIKFAKQNKDYIQAQVTEIFENMPDWNPATESGKRIPSVVNIELRIGYSPIVRGMYRRDGKNPEFDQDEVNAHLNQEPEISQDAKDKIVAVEASGVYKGVNKAVEKGKIAVVMDVTSSMSGNIASLNWWIINSPDSLMITNYTFFNDGDNTPDHKKKIGSTGGIYHVGAIRDVTRTIMSTMRSGDGGDLPENDIESLLAAEKMLNGAQSLLLIADNFSEVKDMKLLDQLQTRVNIIVCGNTLVVRECYMDIVKTTGGVILLKGREYSLSNVQKGGKIVVGETTYSYDGKKFKII